jgi:hypothetical protein
MMSQQLDWTQKLGDAVLAQQPDVMDAIQRLRSRAHANNKLPSTKEQKVTVRQEQDEQVIVIEPTDPETLYVPYYDPAVVYGEWSYPAYPPYYWPAPRYIAAGVLATGIAFGAGYALARWRYGNNIWGGGVNWRNNNLIVNRPIDINKIGNSWQHNPSHRHGVKYSNADVRQKFARTDAQAGKGARQDFRGRSGQQVLDPDRAGAGDRPGVGDRAKAGDWPGAGDRGKVGDRAKAGDRPGAGDRGKAGDRPGAGDRGKAGDRSKVGAGKGGKQAVGRPSRPSGASARQRETAFSGADSGRAARSQADRGRQSMAGHGGAGRVAAGGGGPRVGGGGGGFRGGGGGFRGGGGRRSDIALKHDIVLLGHLDNGLGFYRFSYAGSRKAYVGVVAQEVQAVAPDAVVRHTDGYLRVRYERLGIPFQTYERWKASGARIPAGIRVH